MFASKVERAHFWQNLVKRSDKLAKRLPGSLPTAIQLAWPGERSPLFDENQTRRCFVLEGSVYRLQAGQKRHHFWHDVSAYGYHEAHTELIALPDAPRSVQMEA